MTPITKLEIKDYMKLLKSIAANIPTQIKASITTAVSNADKLTMETLAAPLVDNINAMLFEGNGTTMEGQQLHDIFIVPLFALVAKERL